MRVNENINGTCKIILIKISVGAIVVQGIVEEFLFASGVLDVEDNDRYSAEERAQRALSKLLFKRIAACLILSIDIIFVYFIVMLLLIEYCILSILLYISFGSEIKMNEVCNMESGSQERLDYPLGTFLKKVSYRFYKLYASIK